jgi:hypothetical protein
MAGETMISRREKLTRDAASYGCRHAASRGAVDGTEKMAEFCGFCQSEASARVTRSTLGSVTRHFTSRRVTRPFYARKMAEFCGFGVTRQNASRHVTRDARDAHPIGGALRRTPRHVMRHGGKR